MFSSFKTSFPKEGELMDNKERLELRESLGLYQGEHEEEAIVECAVMATDFERHQLQRMLEERGVAWEKYLINGFYDGMTLGIGVTEPIQLMLDVRFCKINERLVCFFVPMSKSIDQGVVKQWIQDAILPASDGRIRYSESADDSFIEILLDLEIIPRLTR